ncbi:class II aldolase/adducin family protein [Klebsiella quasipneumoniae]|uniref:class II aldolase/adducin family protein n=1 Tax=Klebsiella quasipneumoniae TaxID=1463165 RepID=UPI000CECD633|nr:class II aldolase/adducin family protein [Klebsiella quasipneumoniae]ROC60479.1 class II aldolase/adducin family protein [Klebsiella quasipneumoniae subsp. quasipneumoniae]
MLEYQKQQVVEMAKTAQAWGLCKHKAGNSSVRDPETGLICVTPTTVDKSVLTTRDIVVIDIEGKVIESLAALRPTSEYKMHLAAYRTRPDVNAVCHTHARYASSFAVVNKPIPAIVYEFTILNLKDGYVPVAPFALPGTDALGDSIVEPLKRADAVLLGRHGALTVDSTSYDAVLKSAYIEELAEIYFHALMLNNNKEPEAFTVQELESWRYPDVKS